jgi:hypothetical protein
MDDIPPPKADFSAPPPYELATKLPSYEEAQQQKMQEQSRVRFNSKAVCQLFSLTLHFFCRKTAPLATPIILSH